MVCVCLLSVLSVRSVSLWCRMRAATAQCARRGVAKKKKSLTVQNAVEGSRAVCCLTVLALSPGTECNVKEKYLDPRFLHNTEALFV